MAVCLHMMLKEDVVNAARSSGLSPTWHVAPSKSLGSEEKQPFVFGQQAFCVWSTVTEKHWERKRERMGDYRQMAILPSDVLNVSFNKYLLSINYVPGTLLGTEGTSVSKTNRNPCLHELTS